MFTGIVQGQGRLTGMNPDGGEVKLSVEAGFDWDGPLELGESISVSGVCLTVTGMDGRSFSAHVSGETISRSTLGRSRVGDAVNLERALRLADRLGGHLVAGHVDGLGLVRDRREKDRSVLFTFGFDPGLMKYFIEKGSAAVDGISLTVNEVGGDWFSVNVIPHTAAVTTLRFKTPGDYVNVEADLIGKYVARLLGKTEPGREKTESAVTEKFLAEHGFI